MANDVSLLRAFDLAAVLGGEKICTDMAHDRDYITGPDRNNLVCVGNSGELSLFNHHYLRMRPLCWVDGMPVYKGDVLYSRTGTLPRTVAAHDGDALSFLETEIQLHQSCMTWAKSRSCDQEVSDLVTLLDSAGIPEGPLGWRVREYRREVEQERDLLLEELKNCVAVMERELKGLQVIQPELRGAQEAIAKVTQ